jgi:5'-methylthioadenosine phosphorylase
MTLIPEVFLARELEMCYGSLCYLTNYAEGVQDRPSDPSVLFGGMSTESENMAVEETVRRLPAIARSCLIRLAGMERDCRCKNAMARYKKEGVIGEDWRTWIKPVR